MIFVRLIVVFLFLFPAAGKALINRDSLQAVLDKLDPDSLTLENYLSEAADMGGDEIAAVKLICNWVYEESKEKNLYTVQAHALYGIGRAYLITDDFDPATVYFNKALSIAQKHQLTKTEVSCYVGFGNIYSASKQYPEAERNYKKAIELSMRVGDTINAAYASFNLASLLMEAEADSNAYSDCVRYLDLTISLVTEQSAPDVYINVMGMKAFLYSNAGLYDSVPYFLSEAARVIEAHNFDEYRPQINYYTGLHFLNLHAYDSAIVHFEKGITLGRQMNSLWWVYNFYDAMSRAYAGQGNYEKALFYFKQHKAAYDSLVNEENFNKVLDLRHLYENEKREKEMLETRRAKMISEQRLETEISRKNNLILLVTGVTLALLVFAFLLVRLRRNIRERKEAYSRLEEKNVEIQLQSDQLVRQSKEIARYQSQMNPHFVFNALNSIQGHVMSDDKEKTISQLHYFARLMRQTLNNSDRELITLQVEFEFLRLYFSFEKGRFEKEIELQIISEVEDENTLIPPMLIQPFIENALKHAGLDQVTDPVIRLQASEHNDTLLKIVITDNGLGMRTSPDYNSGQPHATDIVQSRIRLLFATQEVAMPATIFSMTPATDFSSGTQVSFFIPLIHRF